ncbi:1,4-alpha-glucan branching protein GlgB [Oryzibacter oryziterrae]|uniref:1,4-alpha-glucan branching protein GlgB n=1 Tax=Oryzibacter oryziterrae TaxID=2766474 RepID=UPI001F018541|nr:1,4-alpha-glucan branching protein GlgB [Oryzibacter oryziterrae]
MVDLGLREGVLDGAISALAQGTHGDPFAVLGPHPVSGARTAIRAFKPNALSVTAVGEDGKVLCELAHVEAGLWIGMVKGNPGRYKLRVQWPTSLHEAEDPYAFPLLLGEMDVYLLAEGQHRALADTLGALRTEVNGIPGVRFAVWAPNARRVSVIGNFNSWDGRRHPMRLRRECGVWELFVPRLAIGEAYKFELIGADGGLLPDKADPVARQYELAPATASIVTDPTPFTWHDQEWMKNRPAIQSRTAPMSIYELHPGSWQRPQGQPVTWAFLAEHLVAYVKHMGFTHIELLPIMEHPFGGSWGYQPLGLFAPTARYGSPADFARFIDTCHQAGIGVLLDWVPAHFPTDSHGLSRFDGTALYEHQDPREGFHQDWNTLIYNFGRTEVVGFLVASALEWLKRFHIDGLRVDAVASMLYRDYSRKQGEWIPNKFGGRENLEAVAFLKHLNGIIATEVPDALMIAEESTAWPGVSAPLSEGGLGFTYKWNMGWMHDSLAYVGFEPIHRQYHHNQMTFAMMYAYSEHFVLPLSHDEVVHGKRSILGRMPGDEWQKFANLRAYYGFMWTHPGKKLLFMGGEIGQGREWNHDGSIDLWLESRVENRGVQRFVRDMNTLYRAEPALHARDHEPGGFQWVVADDAEHSTFAFIRWGFEADAPCLVLCNFTPVPREGYRVGVPRAGTWQEVLNSDAEIYGGSNTGNKGQQKAKAKKSHGMAQSLELTLPPLSIVVMKWVSPTEIGA